jgi:hypothetical protein
MAFLPIDIVRGVIPGLVPGIPIGGAPPSTHRDGRDEPGHDGLWIPYSVQIGSLRQNAQSDCEFLLVDVQP